jgi:hypothetical protein
MGGWPVPRPSRLLPGKRPDIHFTVGWVRPTAGLEDVENLTKLICLWERVVNDNKKPSSISNYHNKLNISDTDTDNKRNKRSGSNRGGAKDPAK